VPTLNSASSIITPYAINLLSFPMGLGVIGIYHKANDIVDDSEKHNHKYRFIVISAFLLFKFHYVTIFAIYSSVYKLIRVALLHSAE
jgi:hypothetical protein